MAIEVGNVFEGRVTGVKPFGAFVALPEGRVGMVHISEVSNEFVQGSHNDRSCRFTPSCSNYTMQAIMTHGCVKGILLGAWRIARCNPFGKWGFDPVPEPGRWQNPARRLQPARLFSTRHKQKVEK